MNEWVTIAQTNSENSEKEGWSVDVAEEDTRSAHEEFKKIEQAFLGNI